MCSVIRFAFRSALVLGIVGVGAAALFGTARVREVAHSVQQDVAGFFRQNPDDPSVLRSELDRLQREYPEKISQVRADRGRLSLQLRELHEQRAVAARVVELADQDLVALQSRLGELGDARVTADGALLTSRAALLPVERRVERIRRTRDSYAARVEESGLELAQLEEQARLLEELETRLTDEFAELQSQIGQLDRQIDAIERNERLLEVVRERSRTIAELESYGSKTVDQVRSRLEDVLSRQRAELDELLGNSAEDYVERARVEIRSSESCGDERAELRTLIHIGGR